MVIVFPVVVLAGVPQGTRLSPRLFLDLMPPDESFSKWKFADDTSISEVVPTSAESRLQVVIDRISNWSQQNHSQLNPIKCKEVVTYFKRSSPSFNPVGLDGQPFERVSSANVLGL